MNPEKTQEWLDRFRPVSKEETRRLRQAMKSESGQVILKYMERVSRIYSPLLKTDYEQGFAGAYLILRQVAEQKHDPDLDAED